MMHLLPSLSFGIYTLLLSILHTSAQVAVPGAPGAPPPTQSSLGINCRGSFYCLGQDRHNVTGQLLDLAHNISDNDIYGYSVHIACLGAYDPVRQNLGAFCLFMQGYNPHTIRNPLTGDQTIGIQGSLIKPKVLQLYKHGCRACGSVPLSNDNNPNSAGILIINYVQDNAGCSGFRVCPPSILGNDTVHNPLNAVTGLRVVNQTADGSQACAGPGSPVTTDSNGVPLEECGVDGFSPDPTFGVTTMVTSLRLIGSAAASTSVASTVSV